MKEKIDTKKILQALFKNKYFVNEEDYEGIDISEYNLYEIIDLFDNLKNFENLMALKILYFCGFLEISNKLNEFVFSLNKEMFFKLMKSLIWEIPKKEREKKRISAYKSKNKENKKIVKYICDYYKVGLKDGIFYLSLMNNNDKIELLKKYGFFENEIEKELSVQAV
jgi:hypothetical protein